MLHSMLVINLAFMTFVLIDETSILVPLICFEKSRNKPKNYEPQVRLTALFTPFMAPTTDNEMPLLPLILLQSSISTSFFLKSPRINYREFYL